VVSGTGLVDIKRKSTNQKVSRGGGGGGGGGGVGGGGGGVEARSPHIGQGAGKERS